MRAAYKNIARVVRPHGTKGEVLVAPLRGLPLLLTESMRVHLTPPALKRERISIVESLSVAPEGARVRFSCAHDLDEAEGIVGCYVLGSCDDFELGRLDSAVGDLLGRSVVDERFGDLGSIVEVMETPANDVWVLDGSPHGEVLVPVIDEVIIELPEEGAITVRIMDGLLDL